MSCMDGRADQWPVASALGGAGTRRASRPAGQAPVRASASSSGRRDGRQTEAERRLWKHASGRQRQTHADQLPPEQTYHRWSGEISCLAHASLPADAAPRSVLFRPRWDAASAGGRMRRTRRSAAAGRIVRVSGTSDTRRLHGCWLLADAEGLTAAWAPRRGYVARPLSPLSRHAPKPETGLRLRLAEAALHPYLLRLLAAPLILR